MREAEVQTQRTGTLRFGAVTDAHDFELLGEALGDADNHVLDERARQTVEAARLPRVVGTLDHEGVVVLADGDSTVQCAGESALRALHRNGGAADVDVDPGRDDDGSLTDA